MENKDYYRILGVEKDAGAQKIKKAYRNLAFQFHPDRNRGNPSAAERMKEINEAYAVLSEPGKRRNYDRIREQYGSTGYYRFRETYSDQDIFRGSDINQIFEEMARAFGLRGFEEIFSESYGQGYRTFEFRKPGFFGWGFVFSSSRPGREDRHGILPSSGTFQAGLGRLTRYLFQRTFGIKIPQRGADWHGVIHIDPRAAMDGKKISYPHRKRSKELMIAVPAGIEEGQQIRLRGMGAEGKEGGEAGDLYLKVKFKRPLAERVEKTIKGFISTYKK